MGFPVFSVKNTWNSLQQSYQTVQNISVLKTSIFTIAGLNAVFAYRTYDEKDEEEKKEVKEAISTYCQMDTYAEYVVYHGLIKEVEKDA